MSETRPAYVATPTAVVLVDSLTDWEIKLLLKVRRLRAEKKRVILMLDGQVILLYRCEPAGLLVAEVPEST